MHSLSKVVRNNNWLEVALDVEDFFREIEEYLNTQMPFDTIKHITYQERLKALAPYPLHQYKKGKIIIYSYQGTPMFARNHLNTCLEWHARLFNKGRELHSLQDL